ncbi:MAG: hypothetical protein FWH18_09550 [Marinilabiliaceae bacterium]|nr:hypothetical protein [Marinilabiliaceae bacterium]
MNKSSSRIQVQSKVLETAYPNATKNVVAFEESIRKNSFETIAVFDKEGNILLQNSGNEKGAAVPITVNIENGIFTHNHPTLPEDGRYGRIGTSFSDIDIYHAIKFNQAEVRVVTETSTFSMKRPNSGWNVSANEFQSAYNSENKIVTDDLLNRLRYKKTTYDKIIVTIDHKIMKNLSKKYVWEYSKMKTS